MDSIEDWPPIMAEVSDLLAPSVIARLAATLDHQGEHWRKGEVPPLGHWLYFLPQDRQSTLDKDGHPRRGGFLPPIAAPRRMWAAGTLNFIGPLPLGAEAIRKSSVEKIEQKTGRSGALSFVTVRHEVVVDGATALIEMQDLVYRGTEAGTPPRARPAGLEANVRRQCLADSRLLFRYSALTFNAHRIHYDLPYCQTDEDYPGLVVQGPLQATLLMDLLLRTYPNVEIASFTFRGVRALVAGAPFDLNLAEEADGIALWTSDAENNECMRARATIR